MQRVHCAMLVLVSLALLVSNLSSADDPKSRPAETTPGTTVQGTADSDSEVDRAALESKFVERMSGVVLAGRYSVTSGGKESAASMEKYTISRVSRVKDKEDLWLFETRIQYGKTDLPVPLTLPVKWAGDTPIITLTDLTIPALGTFTARVMIHGELYAGTWQHGKTGGHLWGRVEKIEKPDAVGNGKTSESAPGDQ